MVLMKSSMIEARNSPVEEACLIEMMFRGGSVGWYSCGVVALMGVVVIVWAEFGI